jgi:trafficking protein particle complex subunit 9
MACISSRRLSDHSNLGLVVRREVCESLSSSMTFGSIDTWKTQDTVNDDIEPWSDLTDKLSQAINLYYKFTPNSDAENSYPFVSWFYTRAVLRHTSLLYAIWSAKGWGQLAFSTLLQTGLSVPPPTLTEDTHSSSRKLKRMSYSAFQRLTIASGISRSMIADVLAQAHGPWLLHLGSRERIAILEYIAAMYGILGFQRKEAYILREVLGCLMDMIVCGREESGSSKIAGAGLGIQGVDVGTGSQGSVGIRAIDSTAGNDSILRVVKHICNVHGIDLEAVRTKSLPGRTGSSTPTPDAVNDTVPMEEPFGWPELQIGIIREAIAVAEALPG